LIFVQDAAYLLVTR